MDASTIDACILIGAIAAIIAMVANCLGMVANGIKIYESVRPRMLKINEQLVADAASD